MSLRGCMIRVRLLASQRSVAMFLPRFLITGLAIRETQASFPCGQYERTLYSTVLSRPRLTSLTFFVPG